MRSGLKRGGAARKAGAASDCSGGLQTEASATRCALDAMDDGGGGSLSVLGLPVAGAVDPLQAALSVMSGGSGTQSTVPRSTPRVRAAAAVGAVKSSSAATAASRHASSSQAARTTTPRAATTTVAPLEAYRDMMAQLTAPSYSAGAAIHASDSSADGATKAAPRRASTARNVSLRHQNQSSALQLRQASDVERRQALSHSLLFSAAGGVGAAVESHHHQPPPPPPQQQQEVQKPLRRLRRDVEVAMDEARRPGHDEPHRGRSTSEPALPGPRPYLRPPSAQDGPAMAAAPPQYLSERAKLGATVGEGTDGEVDTEVFDHVAAAAALFTIPVSPETPEAGGDGTTFVSPFMARLSACVHPKIFRAVHSRMSITGLTRIQQLSFAPVLHTARDVIIRSETGSGKTLAYLLPLLSQLVYYAETGDRQSNPPLPPREAAAADAKGIKLQLIKREDGTYLLVLCPTRELTIQVEEVLMQLTHFTRFLVVGSLHGGENRHKEKARLRKGISVLVATPGRALDHLQHTSSFLTDRLQTIVLDEADRLLDMGFEKAIREIMSHLEHRKEAAAARCPGTPAVEPIKRVLVSATLTSAVERLSHFTLRKPVIRVGLDHSANGAGRDTAVASVAGGSGLPPTGAAAGGVFFIPASLRQHVVTVPIKHRLSTLLGFLRSQLDAGARRIVVFVSTADSAEFHYRLLSRLRSPFYVPPTAAARRLKRLRTAPAPGAAPKPPRVEGSTSRRDHGSSSSSSSESDDDDDDDGDAEEVPPAHGGAAATGASSKVVGHGSGMALDDPAAFFAVSIFKLHGNMTQVDRASVFHAFKHGIVKAKPAVGGDRGGARTASNEEKGVLFCTDVVARGLDMPAIDWIVHYDPPTDVESYIHRIGRTARIGNAGDSLLFLAPHETGYAAHLSQQTRQFHETPAENAEGESVTGGSAAVMEERRYESFLFYLTKLDPRSQHRFQESTAVLERTICRTVTQSLQTQGRGGGAGFRYKSRDGDGRGRGHGRVGYRDGAAGDDDDNDDDDDGDEDGNGDRNDSGGGRDGDDDALARVALFAYQSYLRYYAGLPREMKHSFFQYDQLHLGHVAHSFGIDKTPRDLQNLLLGTIKRDQELSRKALFQRQRNRRTTGVVPVNNMTGGGGGGGDRRAHGDDGAGQEGRGRPAASRAPYRSAVVDKQEKSYKDWREVQRQEGRLKPAYRHLQYSEFDA